MKSLQAIVYVTTPSLLLLVLTLLTPACPQPMEGCGGHPVDVVFVLDVSSSIWETHFKKHVLTFVRAIVNDLDIGPGVNRTRVGAITFSDKVQMEFRLNQYMDKSVLKEKVSEIKLRGGNTDTHKALQFVRDHMFQPSNGGRPEVSHVVIVITDGASRKFRETEEMASALREQRVALFAIGVGNGINMTQLHAMASRPSLLFVFNVNSFQALENIRNELVNKTCQVLPSTTTTTTTTTAPTSTTTTEPTTTTTAEPTTTTTAEPTTTTTTEPPTTKTTTEPTTTTTATTTTTTPTTTTTTTTPTTSSISTTDTSTSDSPTTRGTSVGYNVDEVPQGDETADCVNHPADVYFVLDTSRSVWEVDFQDRMLPFVRDVIGLFDVGRDLTRVGVITFSDAPHTVFGLEDHLSKEELLKAVNKDTVTYTAGLTHTAEALQQARINLRNEGRPDVTKIVILITDGRSRYPNATVHTARAARLDDGLTLFAVGVGVKDDGEATDELNAVATEPSADHVLMVDGFESLSSLKDLLAGRTCRASNSTTTTMKKKGAIERMEDEEQKGDEDDDDEGGKVLSDRPQPDCQLRHADILFAYDSHLLGGTTSSHVAITLQHLSAYPRLVAADVTLGTMTSTSTSSSISSSSSDCASLRGEMQHKSLPLSGTVEFGKHARSVARLQQSRLASVLKAARMWGFSSNHGHRGSAKKVAVIVLDDGSSRKLSQVAQEAAKLRRDDVEVFVVTSGRRSGGHLVYEMVSEPAFSHVIRLPALDFGNHAYASQLILHTLCGGGAEDMRHRY